MEEYEATFEVESKMEARAVERLMERFYDSLREESRTIREGSGDSSGMLAQFEAIRAATRDRQPGRLTVTYERRGEEFEE